MFLLIIDKRIGAVNEHPDDWFVFRHLVLPYPPWVGLEILKDKEIIVVQHVTWAQAHVTC